MNALHLDRPAAAPSPRLARLTRHLTARLLDFDPGGPQVVRCDQEHGLVSARFPGRAPGQVAEALRTFGIYAALEGDTALFCLDPALSFESLDYVWGCLFEILC